MSESQPPVPPPPSGRDALLARRVTTARCTPVPLPGTPGVFVARMSGRMYLDYLEATQANRPADGDTDEVRRDKRQRNAAVLLTFAAVDERGEPLLSVDEAERVDVGASSPITDLFLAENDMLEKK